MRMSLTDFLSYEARQAAKSGKAANAAVRETGKGGLAEQVETWLKTLGRDCAYDILRTDKRTTAIIGRPDVVGSYKGRPFAVELKAKYNKPSTEQLGQLMRWNRAGAATGIAYSLEEVVEIVVNGKSNFPMNNP